MLDLGDIGITFGYHFGVIGEISFNQAHEKLNFRTERQAIFSSNDDPMHHSTLHALLHGFSNTEVFTQSGECEGSKRGFFPWSK